MPSKTHKIFVLEVDGTKPPVYVIAELGRGHNGWISRWFRSSDNAMAAMRALRALGPRGINRMRAYVNGRGRCPLKSLITDDVYHD